jgi:glycosyltransferase involved in cell wall biosynthesis
MIHANILGRIAGIFAPQTITIISRRSVNLDGKYREEINRFLAPLAQKHIAVSDMVRQIEIENTRVPPAKVLTIYNGIDPTPFAQPIDRTATRQQWGISPDAPLVGMVARLTPAKGLPILLKAFAIVHANLPTARLLLVGTGELESDLMAQTNALDLQNVVIFAGLRKDVPAFLACLDLFVLSSLWEGFPNVLLEAMSAGLPAVATTVGGTPELVLDGETGLLVPPADAEKLAHAILSLLQNPEQRKKMGEAGLARVKEKFSIGNMVQQTESLYDTLLGTSTK